MKNSYFKRMNRKEYFWAIFLDNIVFSAIIKGLAIILSIWGGDYYTKVWIFYVFGWIYLTAIAYFAICRCHDLGKNGWYALLAYIPLVSLYFFLAKGTKERNIYG